MTYRHTKRRQRRAICSRCGLDLRVIVPADTATIVCAACDGAAAVTPIIPITPHHPIIKDLIMTPPRTRVYCASPTSRAKMWREDLIPHIYSSAISVTSTWHENENLTADDQDDYACAHYWEVDFKQIRQSDALLAYAEIHDHPNGTLVEIGYAIAQEIPVYIVGNFAWGTWRHHSSVVHCTTIREAVAIITSEAGFAEGEPQ